MMYGRRALPTSTPAAVKTTAPAVAAVPALLAVSPAATAASVIPALAATAVQDEPTLIPAAVTALAVPAPGAAAMQALLTTNPDATATAASGPPVALVPTSQTAHVGVTLAHAIDITGGPADDDAPRPLKRKHDALTPPPAEEAKQAAAAAESAADQLARGGADFVTHANAWASADLSDALAESVRRAADLTPAERSVLLASVANMIQRDQSKALSMLNHSLAVTQYLTDQVPYSGAQAGINK
jgi:hypothetical protein